MFIRHVSPITTNKLFELKTENGVTSTTVGIHCCSSCCSIYRTLWNKVIHIVLIQLKLKTEN